MNGAVGIPALKGGVCAKSRWPKCPHAWHFNFKPRNRPPYRFSLDAELGRHIESRTEAENEAEPIRASIRAGTFERAADRRARELREAEAARAASNPPSS